MDNIKELKNHYVIIHERKREPEYRTLSYQKNTCIQKFIGGTTLTWKECRGHGWRCVKVNVTFNPTK